MNHFLLIPNRQKDMGLVLTAQIHDMLLERGAVCHIYDDYDQNSTEPINVPENTECILVIGGDGNNPCGCQPSGGTKYPPPWH